MTREELRKTMFTPEGQVAEFEISDLVAGIHGTVFRKVVMHRKEKMVRTHPVQVVEFQPELMAGEQWVECDTGYGYIVKTSG